MPTPRTALTLLLDAHFCGADVVALTPDASTRRFYRVRDDQGSHVVMDYGHPFEVQTDDIRLTRIFLDAALPVARIEAVFPEPGCLVVEDLGSRDLSSMIGATAADSPPDSLVAAVDLAARIALHGSPALARSDRADGPALDADRFRFEMEFFADNYVGGLLGRESSAALRGVLGNLADLAAGLDPLVLCHRDLHSRNLIVRDDGSLALVDIQDARWGPLGYDLVSLLCDAYVELDEDWIGLLTDRYFRAVAPEFVVRDQELRWALLAAQRMIKALGTFGYQIAVVGHRRYDDAVPRTLARLRRLLASTPALADVHRAFAEMDLLESNSGPERSR